MNRKKVLSTIFGMVISTISFAIGVAFMLSAILNDEAFVRSYVFWIGIIISIVSGAMMWKNLKK